MRPSPGDSGRILFALNRSDQDLFFHGGNCGLPAEFAACRWASNEELSQERWVALLEEWRPDVLVTGWSTPAIPAQWVLSRECPLRYVCHVTGSVRGIVPRVFLERGGRVSNWGGLASQQVAEHALLLALAALRKLPEWQTPPSCDGRPASAVLGTRTLFGRRIGLHGFGRVACSLLELLEPFGVTVFGFSDGVAPALMRSRGVEPCPSLKTLFASSEILFECEALTPQSERSINAEVLAALPDGGIFVNVGRGRVVDEPALAREAASGRIRVALDVVANEPLASDAEIARVPNAVFSPHIAGPTADHFPRCRALALDNVGRFLRGEPLEAEVTLEIYDRAT